MHRLARTIQSLVHKSSSSFASSCSAAPLPSLNVSPLLVCQPCRSSLARLVALPLSPPYNHLHCPSTRVPPHTPKTISECITLFCIVHSGQNVVPFSVKVNGGDTICELKQLIKMTCAPKMNNIASHDLKLRKWNKPGDIDYVHLDGIAMLNPMKKIRDIFCGDGFPKEECVHIIITVPEPETTPVEDRKELHHLRKIVEQLKNPFHVFNLIVEPKRMKAIAWNVDINTATLDMLSELICKRYPEYEDSTLLFTFKLHESITCTPETNEQLRELLSSLVVKDKMTVKISVETPTKSFSDWTLNEVMRLYEICDDIHIPDKKGKMKHGLLYFPAFICNRTPILNEKTFRVLMDSLTRFLFTTPLLRESHEYTHSLYVHSFLSAVVSDFISDFLEPAFMESGFIGYEPKVVIIPEQYITGRNGKGPVDFAIEMVGGGVVGVTEVKREDFCQGVAQNAVQLESVLSRRNRKVGGLDEGSIARCFGIVTDAKEWLFLECTYDENEIPKFKLSRTYTVAYGKQSMQEDIKEILEVIKWLLTEALKSATTAAVLPYFKNKDEN